MSLKIFFLLVLPFLSKQSGINVTDNCKNYKCPQQEDPTCIKVVFKKGLQNSAFNVVVYNKCEIGYLKCHPGLKAYVLPMRNCHPTNESSVKRLKREIKRGVRSFHKIGKGKKVYLYGDTLSESASDDANPDEKQRLMNKRLNKKINKDKLKFDDENKNGKDDKTNDDTPRMDSTEALVELNATSREERLPMPKERDPITKNDDRPDSINVIDEPSRSQYDGPNDAVANEVIDGTQQSDEIRIDENSGEKKAIFNEDTKIANDYDNIEEHDANLEEDNKDCPAACALRDVMVCARCNHGVYRTFMSVCHLRAFQCTHTDEKLTLVSRRPCIQSAPFLSDLPPSSGRVHEPSDNDRVFQFIRCRAEGRLNKRDPKCNFDR